MCLESRTFQYFVALFLSDIYPRCVSKNSGCPPGDSLHNLPMDVQEGFAFSGMVLTAAGASLQIPRKHQKPNGNRAIGSLAGKSSRQSAGWV